MNTFTANPIRIIADIYRHRYLLSQLIKRDVLLRYRGALFGVLWIFLSPLIMLAIFAFIFGQIFEARWPQSESGFPFWLILYSGLIAFNLFSESISRAPSSVRNHPNFVKKIIFPVSILPIVPIGSALVHGLFNFLILCAALALAGRLNFGIILFPMLLSPLVLFALALSWLLASWGVFIKDMTQIVPVFVQMLLFLSPVLYPVSAVPKEFRTIYQCNPLSVVIEATRSAIFGQPVDFGAWTIALGFSMIAVVLGYSFFQHSRDEFADAL
jgi:lipopolysaccharide transport system permease protein